jgi:hypothetical protein
MNQLSEEQVAALSPDTASLKAGRDLANARKWVGLFYNDRVLWAEIQGSGKDPYRTQIDLVNTGFKCSCPSRKFPCKHGLGAYLLFANDSSLFTKTEEEPVWVKDWMDKRVQREEKKVIAETEPVSPEKAAKQSKAKEKTQNERFEKIQAGIAELELWLKDMLRTGFISVPEKDYQYWNRTATRLIDAQARGLSVMVKEIGKTNFFAKPIQWQTELIEKTSNLYLLLEAFKTLNTLPSLLQEDIKNLVGVSKTQKEVLDSASESFKDQWLILAKQRFDVEDENLTGQRQWLYGLKTGKTALLLDFTFGNAPIKNSFIPGTVLNAELVFYPSNYPLRAAIKSQGSNSTDYAQKPPFLQSWQEWQNAYANALVQQPWLEYLPAHIAQLSLISHQKQWLLVDESNHAKPIVLPEEKIYELLALLGGQKTDFTLITSLKTIEPVGIWLDDKYIFL